MHLWEESSPILCVSPDKVVVDSSKFPLGRLRYARARDTGEKRNACMHVDTQKYGLMHAHVHTQRDQTRKMKGKSSKRSISTHWGVNKHRGDIQQIRTEAHVNTRCFSIENLCKKSSFFSDHGLQNYYRETMEKKEVYKWTTWDHSVQEAFYINCHDRSKHAALLGLL